MALAPAPVSDRTIVLLRLSAANVSSGNLLFESETQVRVLLRDQNAATTWKPVGMTELVMSASPNFAKPVTMHYIFEQNQYLRFEYLESKSNELHLIGTLECTLGDIIGSRKSQLTRPLVPAPGVASDSSTTLSVTAEEEIQGNGVFDVRFRFRGENLDKKDFLGKSDPFLEIYRCEILEDDTAPNPGQLVHRTEFIKQDLNPRWKEFTLGMSPLCRNDEECPITFKVWDWNKSGKYSYIGEVVGLTLARLRTERRFVLEKRQKSSGLVLQPVAPPQPGVSLEKRDRNGNVTITENGYKATGVLVLDQIDFVKKYSFLDFLTHGLQISLMVGIDYTGSNGDPRRPASLHHISPERFNPYELAISAVASILLQYDYDGIVPVYGFGGLMPDRSTSHCFAVNRNPEAPGVRGVDGILETYRHSFTWAKLDGPTNFAPIIRESLKETIELEKTNDDGILSYMILLIITDGEICDMEETISAIIDASSHAMSIIIVGVGKGPFDNMVELDSDDELLTDKSHPSQRHAERDIVQFVQFDQFANDPALLAAEVLEEIPLQVTSFFASRNIVPHYQ